MSNPYEGDATGGATGLTGRSDTGDGVEGLSAHGNGVYGVNGVSSGESPAFGCGVLGDSTNGYGVYGVSKTAEGVFGTSGPGHPAVRGVNGAATGNAPAIGCGVWGDSETGYGIYGTSKKADAGFFDGSVTVVGTGYFRREVHVTDTVFAADFRVSGLDCAEAFDITSGEDLEPGTVVVFDDGGSVSQSAAAYNQRVAGVISGAGEFRPGVILGHDDPRDRPKALVALVGRVYCKVDADLSPIAVGDLLTTSGTQGHAMKATDPGRAFGAVIGKALRPLESGLGLLPILVGLR
jgi:hypothetical protein